MQTLSPSLATQLRRGGTVATALDVLVTDNSTERLDGLVLDGSVSVERSAVRRRADLTLSDLDGVLTSKERGAVAELLQPFGNEVRPHRGMVVPSLNGSKVETVPLGTLVLATVEIDWPQVRLTAYDRAWLCSKARFDAPYSVPKGTNVVEAIQALVERSLPPGKASFLFPTTDETTPGLVFDADADPWEAAQGLANGLGQQLYFDELGVCTMSAEPDPATSDPAWTFSDRDGDYGTLVSVTPRLDASDAVSGIVLTAENQSLSAPLRAVAWDADPASPTFYAGAFGKRLASPESTDKAGSQVQLNAAAQALMQRRVGLAAGLRLSGLWAPLDVSDLVLVQHERTGVDQVLMVDSVTLGMRASSVLDVNTRERRVVSTT